MYGSPIFYRELEEIWHLLENSGIGIWLGLIWRSLGL